MMPLGRSRLTKNLAGPPLRYAQLVTNSLDGLPSSGRADQFPEAASLRIALSNSASANNRLRRAFSFSRALSRLA